MNYIHTTGRYASGENLFEKLRAQDPEVSSLLARVLMSGDEEVKAVVVLKEAIEAVPMDYSLLDCQATFLQSKGNLEWALPLAQRAVIAAPSEFGTWSKLAEIYIGLEKWDLALLTLNSCPMFTYQDKDAPRLAEPARISLPVIPDMQLDEIDESMNGYDTEMVHPSLRKLSAAGYKGTFYKAYSLLTNITAKIGWDQLLKIRSQVFVMEEEYRSEKAQPAANHVDGRNSSTVAIHAPSPSQNGDRASVDSQQEALYETQVDGGNPSPGQPRSNGSANEPIDRPEHTIASVEVMAGSDEVSSSSLRYPFLFPLTSSSLTPLTQITPTSNTNASASAGSTISSWCSTKTSASTLSGAPTWRAPKPLLQATPPRRKTPSTPSTVRALRSGKFLAN